MKKQIQQGSAEEIRRAVENDLAQVSLSDEEKERFRTLTEKILVSCNERSGEDTAFSFLLQKRLSHLELKIYFSGERFNPVETIEDQPTEIREKFLSRLPHNRSTIASFRYLAGKNIITIRSPYFSDSKNFLKNPIGIAIVLGIIGGLICQQLPADANAFIVNDLVTPLFSLYTKVISGLMGPILFLTLIIAISAMENLRQLNTLGLKLFGRFVLVIAGILIVSAGVALLFFHQLKVGTAIISVDGLMEMIFSIVPTNLVTPFTDNNYSQLMMLAFGLGAVVLILGERVNRLMSLADEARQCLNVLWEFIRKFLPIVPFAGIFGLVASNRIDVLLSSWKFIVAAYVVFTFCPLFKLIKVSLRLKVNPLIFLRKLKEPALLGLSTGTFISSMDMRREISVRDLGIEKTFSEFWMSMSLSLFQTSVPVYVVLSVIFLADLYGTPVSLSFFALLAFVTLQFSLASPGITTACTVTYEQLGIETHNVGLITTCRLFIKHYDAMCSVFLNDLEQVEAAYVNHAIDLEKLRS